MSANLYKIVDREKRILYEERAAGPRVSIVRTGSETIAADEEVTIAVDIRLSEALAENVTINLVGSGSATYNDDYTVSVGGTDCPMVTEDNCPVTITAGQLGPNGDVVITIIDDGRTNEPAEDIILSMVVASPAVTDLLPRGPFALTIPADLPLPAVSLSATSTSIAEGGSATLTATLSEMLDEDVVINLLESGAANYGTGMDWHLNNGSDCNTASGTSCQITILANQRTATATVNVNSDMTFEGSEEEFTVEIDIASPDSTVVIEGSPSSLTFTIPAEQVTVSVDYSGGSTISAGNTRMRIDLSQSISDAVMLTIVAGGTADFGLDTGDWGFQYNVISAGGTPPNTFASGTQCTSGRCQARLEPGETIIDIFIETIGTGSGDTITVSVEIPMASQSLLELGNSSSQTITIQ